MLNIKTKAVADTSFLHLRDAADDLLFTGEGEDRKAVGITLYGPGSRPYVAANTKRQNRMMKRLREKGKMDVSSGERLTEQAEFLAAVTVSFDHFDYPDAGDGTEMFQAAYADPTIGYIADQVAAYIAEWGNFLPSSKAA